MSKLEALMASHLKRQQAVRDTHTLKVTGLEAKLAQNTEALRLGSETRNKAVDEFHKTTTLTGRAFVEALDALHAGIDASVSGSLVDIPDGSGYGAELAAALGELDQEFDTERVKIEAEEAAVAAVVVPPTPSPAEVANLAKADTSNDGIFKVLTGVGAKAEDLKTVLGVESAAARKAGREITPTARTVVIESFRKLAGS